MLKFRMLSLIAACFICATSISQVSLTDSLKAVLVKSPADTSKVNTLVALSKAYMNTSPEEGLRYAAQARDLAEELQFVKGQAYALKYVGMYYYFNAKKVEVLDNWLKSLSLFRSIKFNQGISNMLSNIGALYYNEGDDAKAIGYYLQSLQLAEELGDKLQIATSLQNIGTAYLRKKATLGKGVQYLLRALPLSIELNNQEAIVTIYTNIGEGYFSSDKIDSSLLYYQKGLAASKSSEQVSTIGILNKIGEAYAKKGSYDIAIKYQNQSVALAKKLNAQYLWGKSLLGLANTYYSQGNISASLASYKEAEAKLKNLRSLEELKDIYAGLTEIYKINGDNKSALFYQTLFTNYKDSIYNSEVDRTVSNLQMDFDLAQKELRINRLTKDQALKEVDLQKQRATRNVFAIAFILILIIAFVIFRSYRQKVKTNLILDKQKAQIENLMHNILPEEVAAELQEHGHATPRYYESVSVLFTDFKSFTSLADKMTAKELIEELNDSFIAFDEIIVRNELEKIKTIGDSYMCAGGIPTPVGDHAIKMVKAGLEIQAYIREKNRNRAEMGLAPWELRVGIHVGPIVAGVVGKKKYAYDIWGNTVNVASRMESNGESGRVNISASTYELVKDVYPCTHRGKISAKNVGDIDMFFVEG